MSSRSVLLLATLVPAALVLGDDDAIVQLHGSGTTNPSRLFWEVMDLIEVRAKMPMHITYRAIGSSGGQADFLGANNDPAHPPNDFGAGDIPMKQSNFDALPADRKMVHIPFALGGIGVFHSVPTAEAGDNGNLHLTGCVLAKIFSRQITTWDDPAIVELNPGMTATADIKVVHRRHGSSSTSGFTSYMDTKCPESWSGAGWETGSTITWPDDTAEAQGSGNMAAYIVDNQYAIGYIDAGHGHSNDLSEVALQNYNGAYLTTTEANIGAAVNFALGADCDPATHPCFPTDPTSTFAGVKLYDMPGADTWPITMVSYFYVNQDLSSMDPDSAALLIYFIKFILGDEGQGLAQNAYNMFEPIPQDLQTYNADTISSLLLPENTPTFMTESAAVKMADGQAQYWISGKRKSYGEVERARFEDDIADLTATVNSLTSRVAYLMSQLTALAEGIEDSGSEESGFSC